MKIYKIPFVSGLGRTEGCEQAPDEMEKFLKKKENKIADSDGLDLEFIDIRINSGNIIESNEKIISKLNLQQKTAILGGDHSVSCPAVKSFFKNQINSKDSKVGLIMFDAHADLMPFIKEQTHEDWLRKLINEKIILPENILLIGLRNVEPVELNFMKEHRIRTFFMDKIPDLNTLGDLMMEFARNFQKIYISFDMDVIDPAFAPGVSCPEPAGFSSREILNLMKRLFMLKNINVFDLTEIDPQKDINDITLKLGAELIKEFSKGEIK